MKGAVMAVQEQRQSFRFHLEEQNWSNLWRLPLQDGLKLLLWKITIEAIPVRAPAFRLNEYSDSSQLICVGCGQHNETVLHVFHGCTLANLLWSTSIWGLHISRIPDTYLTKWIHILLNAETLLGIRPLSFQSFILHTALLMDVLWFSRNKAIHDGVQIIASDLQNSLSLRFSDHSVSWLLQVSRPAICWIPPEPDQMKIKFDVAIRQSGSFSHLL